MRTQDFESIQQQVKEKYGLDVGYQNVYALLKASGQPGKRGRKKSSTAASKGSSPMAAVNAGLAFIKAAGGIAQAKAVMQTIEDIKSL